MKKIAVYCSSRTDLGAEIEELAAGLGRWIGQQGHELVYGGVNAGLMHTVAAAAAESGATVTGVVPEVFRHRADPVCTNLIFTSDLNTRKAEMIRSADIFVVLPGGIGTIDEWISTLSFIMVAERTDPGADKPIVAVNHEGMYDGMLTQLFTTAGSVFARGKRLDRTHTVSDLTSLLAKLQSLCC